MPFFTALSNFCFICFTWPSKVPMLDAFFAMSSLSASSSSVADAFCCNVSLSAFSADIALSVDCSFSRNLASSASCAFNFSSASELFCVATFASLSLDSSCTISSVRSRNLVETSSRALPTSSTVL